MTDTTVTGKFVQYAVRPVTRYIVTRYEREVHESGLESSGTSSGAGAEYDNYETAYAVGYALAEAERNRLGYALDDQRIIYPFPQGMGS